MIEIDEKVKTVLTTYHQRMIMEEELMKSLPMKVGMKRRDEFLLSVGKDAAVFLNSMIKSAKSKTILEVGTSYGYSTIWLSEAARATGGKVITLEIDNDKATFAKNKIEAAGLSAYVDFKIGNALESIQEATEQFDFVLLDIWKELYIPCFDLFFPKLKQGAYVMGDNMISPAIHQKDAKAYRNHVQKTNAFDSVLLPIGSGIEVSLLK